MSDDALADVRAAIARGQMIQAIKLYREKMGCGLKEAKDAVEAMAATSAIPMAVEVQAPGRGALREEDLAPIRELLQAGQKIEAIKLVRQRTGLGLKEAKDAVDAMDPAVAAARAESAPKTLDERDLARVRDMARAGDKIGAIKFVRERTGQGLAEAKNMVEGIAAVPLPGAAAATHELRGEERSRVRERLISGDRTSAIQLYRDLSGQSLAVSTREVEAMERSLPADGGQRVGRPVKGCLGALLGLLIPLP